MVSVTHLRTQPTAFQERQAETVWTILARFGYEDVCAELGGHAAQGARIHRLENILTLNATDHDRFDGMRLWFEEVPGGVSLFVAQLRRP